MTDHVIMSVSLVATFFGFNEFSTSQKYMGHMNMGTNVFRSKSSYVDSLDHRLLMLFRFSILRVDI